MKRDTFLENALAGAGIGFSECSHCYAMAQRDIRGGRAVGIFESVRYWKDAAGHVRESISSTPLCREHAQDCVAPSSAKALLLREKCRLFDKPTPGTSCCSVEPCVKGRWARC